VIATLCAALFTGEALYISLVEHPVRMADMAIALREFRHSYRRAAPSQASTAVICFLTAVLLSALATEWWWAIGGSTVGAVVPFTLLVMLQTNKHLLDEKARLNPDEATSLLEHWGQLHWVRSILGTLGLVVLLAKDVL
jgi:hypothetical protein